MKLHGTLLGLLLMAVAAVVFAHTLTFPAFAGQRWGPALFPQLLSAGIFLCGLVIAWQGWRSGVPLATLSASLQDWRGRLSFLAMPLAIGFYLLAAQRLGFIPTAAILVAALAWWFGVRGWKAVLLGVAASLIVHWFFASLMRVPLPRGWFMQLVAGG